MCDRTHDFTLLANQFKGNSTSLELKKKTKKQNDVTIQLKTAFNEAASEIAKGIHKTSGLLTKLTNLVKRQGLFDDPIDEINNLIYRIKQDLDELNSKCDTAQKFVDTGRNHMFGGNTDSGQSTAHNFKVVSHLKTDLMVATKDFKNVLELRSSKMKDQQERKVQLIGKSVLSPLRQIENSPFKKSHNISNDPETGAQKFSSPNLSNPYASDFNGVHLSDNQQQQQLLLAPIADNQYYDAREQAVTEVEKTIGELGQLFKRLAGMISEQQEMIERIDEDIESSASNAEKAHNILLKTYETVSSNKGMYWKLLGISAGFAVVFVLFLM